MDRVRKLFLLLFSLVIGIALISVPYSGSAANKVLKIGSVAPETGDSADLGQAQRRGIQMACDEINEQGWAGDWKLEPHFEDDEGNPTKAASVTNKLIQETKVPVIIGAINSSCTLAAMVHTERAGIPQITSGSTGASITAQGNKWIFRTAVNDSHQAIALIDYAINRLNLKKVSTFTAADDYGQSGAVLLKAAADKAGLEVVVEATYNTGDKDFKPQLLLMKERGTEAIFMWGIYVEPALIGNQARLLGMDCQLFAASGSASHKLIELGGEALQGMILTQSFLPESDIPRVKSFIDNYNKRFGEDPIPHAAQPYDSVYIIADAVRRIDTTDPVKLRDAIANTSGLELVTGSPRFAANGDDVGKRVLITEIRGDAFRLVEIAAVELSD
ncbi:MAG: ABC transporter substrate-binding protein [Firmicutes bacterium]|jgi:branched-chain amino acid transport system substrate-binding protein|nr:ABC transporter substrate-binding protein [Bacillota bacterium]